MRIQTKRGEFEESEMHIDYLNGKYYLAATFHPHGSLMKHTTRTIYINNGNGFETAEACQKYFEELKARSLR